MTTRYVTVAVLKDYCRNEIPTADDAVYDAAIQAAEMILDNACARKFIVADAVVSSARSYIPSGGNLLLIDDAVQIVSITDNGATLTAGTDYQAEPLNNLSDAGETVPYYILRRIGYQYNHWYNWYGIAGSATISVTARWGWAAIPAMIVESCKIIAKDVMMNRNSAANGGVSFGLVAVSEAGGVGTRDNWVVRKAVDAYRHPNSVGSP
jgi:hypothetical protein